MFAIVTAANLFFTGCYPIQIQSDTSGSYYDSPRDYNIDELNQYGQWINIDHYGQVWKPSVVEGWEPYYNGHWIYSNDSWTWVSYEPFGWVVYHYGNWYNDPDNGWVWIPGNNGWSPAVVQWYEYDNYVSWAPLPPNGVTFREPWNDRDSRYWHTVNDDVFLKDNVGHFQEVHPVQRRNNGERPSNAPPSSPKNQGGNQGVSSPTVSTPITRPETPPTSRRNQGEIQGVNAPDVTKPIIRDIPPPVRPKEMAGERTSVPASPAPENIQKRTGQKVENVTITRDRPNTPSVSKLQKMNIPDRERKRVDSHQQEIKQNVLVPNRPQNPRPPALAPPAKKDDKKP